MAAGTDTYKALRPLRWDGKKVRPGGKISVDMRDPRTSRKINTLVSTRWLALHALGTGADKGAR